MEFGTLNFKMITKLASLKTQEKYKKDWINSKYMNIWMIKTCQHPSEIYMTQFSESIL